MKADATNQNRRAIILAGGDGPRTVGDNAPDQRRFDPKAVLFPDRRWIAARTNSSSRFARGRQESDSHLLNRAHERHYRDLVNEILPENLVIQPANRGTAPAFCIRLSVKSPAMHMWRYFLRIISWFLPLTSDTPNIAAQLQAIAAPGWYGNHNCSNPS